MFALCNPADVKTLLFLGIYFYLLVIAWNSLFIVFWLLVCWFSFLGAVASHNAMHQPVFKDEIGNLVMRCLLTLSYGHPVSTYIPGHNITHHGFTELRQDLMRTSKVQYKWHLLNGLLFMPTVAGSVFWGDMKFMFAKKRLSSKIFRNFLIESIVLIGVSVWLIMLDWQKFIWVFLIPHLFAQWAIVTLNMLQHDGCDIDLMTAEGKRLPADQRSPNTSRNFTGWFINFFAYNNGYHSIHHLKPRLHWSEAREQHEKLIKPYIHPNLEQDDMAIYIFRTFIYPGIRIRYDGKPIIHAHDAAE